MAWLTARLSRAKEIPALDKLIGQQRPQREQSIVEQRAVLHRISDYFGIPLTKAKKKPKGQDGD